MPSKPADWIARWAREVVRELRRELGQVAQGKPAVGRRASQTQQGAGVNEQQMALLRDFVAAAQRNGVTLVAFEYSHEDSEEPIRCDLTRIADLPQERAQ